MGIENRLQQELKSMVREAGEVQDVYVFSEAPFHWSAIFSTELAALRVYHAYGGSQIFGTRRVKKIDHGPFFGSFQITNHPGKVSA